MSVARSIREYLEREGVSYVIVPHRPAFTAQETAHAAHVKGREMAKVVVLRAGERFVMAVLPAHYRVDLEQFRQIAGVDEVRLAREAEFVTLFPEVETGAMPPLGDLYDMPIYEDESLTRDREIAFGAGSHSEVIRVGHESWSRLAHPLIAKFARPS